MRKQGKDMPSIVRGGWVCTPDGGYQQFLLHSDEGQAWLDDATRFYFDCEPYQFTAKLEKRANGFFWYAYRKDFANKLQSAYLGKTEVINMGRLSEVGAKLLAKCYLRMKAKF